MDPLSLPRISIVRFKAYEMWGHHIHYFGRESVGYRVMGSDILDTLACSFHELARFTHEKYIVLLELLVVMMIK